MMEVDGCVRATSGTGMRELTNVELDSVAGARSTLAQIAREAALASLMVAGTITTHATELP
jgi:hypothetical protein